MLSVCEEHTVHVPRGSDSESSGNAVLLRDFIPDVILNWINSSTDLALLVKFSHSVLQIATERRGAALDRGLEGSGVVAMPLQSSAFQSFQTVFVISLITMTFGMLDYQ